MGQSASSQREREDFRQRDYRRFSQLVRERETRQRSQMRSRASESRQGEDSSISLGRAASSREEQSSTLPFATFRRQISAQSIPARADTGGTSARDEVLYEQEERPLVNMEDLRMRDAPITNITASPMPRRPSVVSRIGSRLMPRYTATGSARDGLERSAEGRTLRRRLSDTPPQRRLETPDVPSSHRFSLFSPLSPGTSPQSRSNRPRQLAPISSPIPLMVDGSLPSSGLPTSPLRTAPPEQSSAPHRRSTAGLGSLSLRSSRLSRVRRSISTPLDALFSPNSGQTSQGHDTQTPPRRPARVAMSEDADYLLPPLAVTDTNIDFHGSPLAAIENTEPREARAFSPVAETPDRSPSWAQRWAERTPTVRREARSRNLLRGRSSRLIRRDDEVPLSRILQLAAAAIAAQLSGTPEAVTNMQALGAEGLDGSLNTFIQTLNHAATNADNGNDINRTVTTLPPLNFLRVFRFVNTNSDNRPGASTPQRQTSASRAANNQFTVTEDEGEGSDGRTVTLVVVGVRSVPSANLGRDNGDGGDPSLDTLLNLPIVPPNIPSRGGTGGLLRHADGSSRFVHRRRASMGGVNPFPANYDSQRHQRMHSSSRHGSGDALPASSTPIPIVLSESPPGPHPPPSTPADPGLSAQPSGTTTPSRRPSSASAVQHPSLPYQDNALQRLQEAEDLRSTDDRVPWPVRQRRRSDSETARHRDLGAGSARRNGVVEPDDAPSQGRSWLIYVVGTNLSEDHPAFATPSLFTDVSIRAVPHCSPNRDMSY